jgi:hypothetical protein
VAWSAPRYPFDYTANRLIYAPTFSGSLSGDYTVPTDFGSVVASASWRHISPYDEQISIVEHGRRPRWAAVARS